MGERAASALIPRRNYSVLCGKVLYLVRTELAIKNKNSRFISNLKSLRKRHPHPRHLTARASRTVKVIQAHIQHAWEHEANQSSLRPPPVLLQDLIHALCLF